MTTSPQPVDHIAEARRLLTLVRPTALTNEELLEFLAFDKSAATVIAAANAHTRIALVDAVLSTGSPVASRVAVVEAGEAVSA